MRKIKSTVFIALLCLVQVLSACKTITNPSIQTSDSVTQEELTTSLKTTVEEASTTILPETTSSKTSPSTTIEETTEESTSPEPSETVTAIETPSDADLDAARSYLRRLNNYYFFSHPEQVISDFNDISDLDPIWAIRRLSFDWEIVNRDHTEKQEMQIRKDYENYTGGHNPLFLDNLNLAAKQLIHPDIQIVPDESTAEAVGVGTIYNSEGEVFYFSGIGGDFHFNTYDFIFDSMTISDDIYEAVVYELFFDPLPLNHFTYRNYGLLISGDRHLGYFEHPAFDINEGQLGPVLWNKVRSDEGSLDAYRYRFKKNEEGQFYILSKALIPGDEAYIQSIPDISSATAWSALVHGTNGQTLRIRSSPSLDAEQIDSLDANAFVYAIGPVVNGFVFVIETGQDDLAQSGYAHTDYLQIIDPDLLDGNYIGPGAKGFSDYKGNPFN